MKKPLLLCALGAFALGIGLTKLLPEPSARAADTASQPTTGIKVGAPVAPFSLPDTNGKSVEVGNWKDAKASVFLFVATQCPVSNAYNERMAALAKTYEAKGVKFYGVNSNKQEDVAEIAQHSKTNGFTFPVLKDDKNVIADQWNARVTPEVFVVSSEGTLVYHGQIDNSQNENKVKSRPLAAALDAILEGKAVPESETKAFGCTIKRVN